ncbi:AMP-binding protein, partial [Streptomyces sp. SID7760]|nr:AMP-binding protein [Streptomyces sp. SID7760]
LIALASADDATAVGSLPFLTTEDEERLAAFAEGGVDPVAADASLHTLFEEVAARTPEQAAVICAGQEVTYRELDAWAEGIADRLRTAVEPGTPVGVCVERS